MCVCKGRRGTRSKTEEEESGANKGARRVRERLSLPFSLFFPFIIAFYCSSSLSCSSGHHRRRRGSVPRGGPHRRGGRGGEDRLLLRGLLLLRLLLLLLRGLLRLLLRARAHVLRRRSEGAPDDRDEVVQVGRAELVLFLRFELRRKKFWFFLFFLFFLNEK